MVIFDRFPSFFGTFTRHCPHPMAQDPTISEDRLELSMPGAALHDIEAFAYAERLASTCGHYKRRIIQSHLVILCA
jgi:hypothetical protein